MSILVIGLDGTPLDLIRKWSQMGDLPNLKKVMDRGVVSDLQSTMPPTSGPSWSAFITGQNPGKTGVYDFLYRQPGTYTFYPQNARRRAGRSMWAILSQAGKRVAAINVPMSYPVEPVNGVMISGWMTPFAARDFTHPPELLEELEARTGRYHIYPLATYREGRPEAYFDASHRLLEKRTAVALHLMGREAWDLFAVVFFDTDRVLHQVWHHLEDDEPPGDLHRMVRRYFQHLDRSIGQLIDRAGEDGLVVVMSDHGMGRARLSITLNTWLLERGLMQLKGGPVTRLKRELFHRGLTLRNVHLLADRVGLARYAEYRSMYSVDRVLKRVFLSFDDVDWSRTRAYSFGRAVGPIFLNVRGREPEGIIEPGPAYEREREAVASLAREWVHPQTGHPLVGRVLRREEVYRGPALDQAPDLILVPRDAADTFFGLADFGSNRVVEEMYRYTGMHRDRGMLLMAGPRIRPGARLEGPQIVDLAPTILHALEVAVPEEMDGRPLIEAFNGGGGGMPSRGDPADGDPAAGPASEYTAEEAGEIEGKLRSMGYMG